VRWWAVLHVLNYVLEYDLLDMAEPPPRRRIPSVSMYYNDERGTLSYAVSLVM